MDVSHLFIYLFIVSQKFFNVLFFKDWEDSSLEECPAPLPRGMC